MAQVPIYTPRVDPRPVRQTPSRSGVTAESFGLSAARGMQELGSGIGAVGDAIRVKQTLEADATAREALEEYRTRQRTLLHDPRGGYLNATGSNALNGRATLDEQLRSAADDIGRTLDPRARRIFDENVQRLQSSAADQAIKHESNQSRAYVTNQRQSTIDGLVEDATTNWNDTPLFEQNLSAAAAEQQKLAQLEGWDSATLENAQQELVSSAVRQRAILIAENDPGGVEAYIDENRERLTQAHEYELDTSMKSLVLEHKANQFLAEHVHLPQEGVTADPYQTRVVGAESGGNPNARNQMEGQTAGGLHGFTRGTFVDEVRKMRAAGLAPWAEGLSEEQIAQLRFKPEYSTETFEFFRTGNQAQIRALGMQVTPTTEYVMHHFGDGDGQSILRMIKSGQGGAPLYAALKNPVAVLGANPQIKGSWTVAQLYDYAASKMGADAHQRSDLNFFDAGAAYAAAAKIEDPELQEQVIKRIEQLDALQQRQRAAERAQAGETAWDLYQTEGVTDLPFTLRRSMGEAGYSAWQEAVRNDQIGINLTDMDTHELLTRMAGAASRDDKAAEEFAGMDLSAHRGKLSRSDYQAFVQMQEATRTALAGAAATDNPFTQDFAGAADRTRDIYEAFVEDEPDKNQDTRRARLEYETRLRDAMIAFYEREQRKPLPQEERDIAAVLAMQGQFIQTNQGWAARGMSALGESFTGNKGREGFVFQMGSRRDGEVFEPGMSYDEIPVEDRTRVARVLMEANGGRPPTEDEITEFYENERLLGIGAPAAVTDIDEVPLWLIEEERIDNPDITDGELIEFYQAYLASQYGGARGGR